MQLGAPIKCLGVHECPRGSSSWGALHPLLQCSFKPLCSEACVGAIEQVRNPVYVGRPCGLPMWGSPNAGSWQSHNWVLRNFMPHPLYMPGLAGHASWEMGKQTSSNPSWAVVLMSASNLSNRTVHSLPGSLTKAQFTYGY